MRSDFINFISYAHFVLFSITRDKLALMILINDYYLICLVLQSLVAVWFTVNRYIMQCYHMTLHRRCHILKQKIFQNTEKSVSIRALAQGPLKISFCCQTNQKIVYLEQHIDNFWVIDIIGHFKYYLQPININISL